MEDNITRELVGVVEQAAHLTGLQVCPQQNALSLLNQLIAMSERGDEITGEVLSTLFASHSGEQQS